PKTPFQLSENLILMGKKIIKSSPSKVVKRQQKKLVYDHPATDSGMLAGADETHKPDLKTSKQLMKLFEHKISGFESAIDLAGGVGRTASKVLLPRFNQVDLQDINFHYISLA
ncbi:MAG: hypothetical protein ACKO96_49005, partial [Flammeovirgaceae bacterium]